MNLIYDPKKSFLENPLAQPESIPTSLEPPSLSPKKAQSHHPAFNVLGGG